MQQELVQKIHEQKYQAQMSFEEYSNTLNEGFDLIRTSGLGSADSKSRHAVNLALEYNMELMVNYLSV